MADNVAPLPGARTATPPEGDRSVQRTMGNPRAKLSLTEIAEALKAHGHSAQAVRGFIASGPDYTGHRKCLACGAFHLDTGEALHRCPDCGWCRHAVVIGGECQACGELDPVAPELGPEHFEAHHMDPTGKVAKVVKR